jgi:hypothetical protein
MDQWKDDAAKKAGEVRFLFFIFIFISNLGERRSRSEVRRRQEGCQSEDVQ